jgi:aspartyl-tRNA(Asn)/glutamyl-tRNA(Gln) amidotransferase subunit C
MKLDIDAIEKIAELAKLTLSENEKKRYAEELSVVLGYVDMLSEVETEGVFETTQVTGLEDVVREDTVYECPKEVREKLIEQFPERDGNLLKVRAVFADNE